MSYSSVCQGLQSYLEPGLIEIEPRVLKLKLAPPGSNLSTSSKFPSSTSHSSSFLSLSESEIYEKPLTNTATHNITEPESGWSFLQSLSTISHCNKTEGLEAENVYVHPSVKHSSSKFSAQSLELCTENLGCESGCSNASDSTLFSLESRFSESFTTTSVDVAKRSSKFKRCNRDSRSFPPPLTSITDLGGFQVRSHREDGRLILEAVTSSSPQPYFQAERANGRLRLRLFESVTSCCDDDDDDDDEGEGETLDNQEACDIEEEAGLVEVLEEYVGCGEDEMEMEMTKFARPRRCKESGNRDIFGDAYFELPSLSLCL